MALDRNFVHELYQRYGHVVFHRCRGLLQNEEEAREMTQEVFIRLLDRGDGLTGQASPLTWMYRVSTNLCLNRLRDLRTRQGHLDRLGKEVAGEVADDGFPTSSHLPGPREAERRALIRTLLSRVDLETQSVVVLTYFDDLPQEEVALILELSVPTVKKRLERFEAVSRRTLAVEADTLRLLVILSFTEVLPWN